MDLETSLGTVAAAQSATLATVVASFYHVELAFAERTVDTSFILLPNWFCRNVGRQGIPRFDSILHRQNAVHDVL